MSDQCLRFSHFLNNGRVKITSVYEQKIGISFQFEIKSSWVNGRFIWRTKVIVDGAAG